VVTWIAGGTLRKILQSKNASLYESGRPQEIWESTWFPQKSGEAKRRAAYKAYNVGRGQDQVPQWFLVEHGCGQPQVQEVSGGLKLKSRAGGACQQLKGRGG